MKANSLSILDQPLALIMHLMGTYVPCMVTKILSQRKDCTVLCQFTY